MQLLPTECAICNSVGEYTVLYPATFHESDRSVEIFSARRLPDRIHYQIVKCKKCGLVRSHPVLSPEKLDELYKKSKFTYENEVENLTDTYMRALNPVLAKLNKNAHILEIGCGNGFMIETFQKNGYVNCSGSEPSIQAVSKASDAVRPLISLGMFSDSQFPDESFDLICFFQTFDHIADPNSFLQTCYKKLKKGGYIVAYNHDVESISAKALRGLSPIFDIEHTYLYSKKTIRKVFELNKFLQISNFSPKNTLSYRHLLWLFPLPLSVKKKIICSSSPMLDKTTRVMLGNVCYVGRKHI